jgi:hypothetical protein
MDDRLTLVLQCIEPHGYGTSRAMKSPSVASCARPRLRVSEPPACRLLCRIFVIVGLRTQVRAHGANVRFGSKADLTALESDVCSAPESGHRPPNLPCRNSATRRHQIASSPRQTNVCTIEAEVSRTFYRGIPRSFFSSNAGTSKRGGNSTPSSLVSTSWKHRDSWLHGKPTGCYPSPHPKSEGRPDR